MKSKATVRRKISRQRERRIEKYLKIDKTVNVDVKMNSTNYMEETTQ